MAKSTKPKVEKVIEPIVKPIEEIVKEEEIPNPIFDKKETFENIATALKYVEPKVVEEKTEEEKILDYVANSNLEKVDLTPLIKSLYPMVTFSEPAKYLQHQESKRLKLLFSKMVQDGSVKLESELYTRLGSPYWIEGDTKTKHHTIESTKIVAVK